MLASSSLHSLDLSQNAIGDQGGQVGEAHLEHIGLSCS